MSKRPSVVCCVGLAIFSIACGWFLAGVAAPSTLGAALETGSPGSAPEVQYKNYRDPHGPWSIHVVRVPRNSRFELRAIHARGRAEGLGRLSEQVRLAAGTNSTVL